MGNRKKVLLVNSSYKDMFSRKRGTCTCPPIGILSLASVLEREGHEVSVIDCMVETGIFQKILRARPQIVGISATTFSFKNAKKIAAFARKNFPGCIIVVGGCHASYFDEKILQECGYIDAVVRFEGEYTLKELVAGMPMRKIRGLTYRKKCKIVRNPDRPPIEDLDLLPFMARHLVGHNEYGHIHERIIMAKPEEYAVIFTSRGCPRNCGFCASAFLNKRRARFRSAENVCAEIRMLAGAGIRFITIYDEDFLINKERVRAICTTLREERMSFSCMARVDAVSEEIVRLLADSGCKYLFFGIENYSEKVLKYLKKGIRPEQIKNAVSVALKHRICVLAGFIIGTPVETKGDLAINRRELASSGIDWPDFARLSFLPGTALWEEEVAAGRLDEEKYWDRPVFTEDLYPERSREELVRSIEKLRKNFFFSPRYLLAQIYRGLFWRADFIKLNKTSLVYAFTPGINKPKRDSGFT